MNEHRPVVRATKEYVNIGGADLAQIFNDLPCHHNPWAGDEAERQRKPTPPPPAAIALLAAKSTRFAPSFAGLDRRASMAVCLHLLLVSVRGRLAASRTKRICRPLR